MADTYARDHHKHATDMALPTSAPRQFIPAYCAANCSLIGMGISLFPMTPAASQATLAAAMGLVTLFVVVRLSRRGQLSFRYALGWMAVSALGILAGLFVPLAEPVADALGLSAAALVALLGVVFFVLIAIQLSISISGLQKQNRELSEKIANLYRKVGTSNSSQ